MKEFKVPTPIILAVILYGLIYLVRFQQGGWEVELDLFPKAREKLDEKISIYLPSPQAQLLSGIVLGEKKDLPFDLRLALRDTSTLHMVVVSGQNLSLLAVLLLKLSGLLTRRVAVLLTFLVISGYVVLTGGQIPVLRAALMALLAGLAQLFGRQNDGFRVLILVASLLLLLNPEWVYDLSFQLSFLATFGVVVIAPILASKLEMLPVFIKENLSLTVGAQLAVFPIIAQNFHQLSLVSIPANLLTLWTIPYIMSWGLLMLILTQLSDFATKFVAIGLNLLLTYFIYIVQFFGNLPFAWEYVGEQIWVVWLGYYLILAAVMLSLKNGKRQNFTRS